MAPSGSAHGCGRGWDCKTSHLAGICASWQKSAQMETKAKRTLVKSAPELWGLADDLERMELWMAGVLGSADRVPIKVTRRDPERALAWSRDAGGDYCAIALELAESGFGTAVRIIAHHPGGHPASETLERLLDELGSPERKPFRNA